MGAKGSPMVAVSAHVQAIGWILLAAAVAYYGNGEQDLWTLLLHEPRLNRPMLNIAFVGLGANILVFAYLVIWLEGVMGREDAMASVKWAEPAGGATFAVAVISFILGLWPMFSALALPIVLVETYGIIMALHYAPTFGMLRIKKPLKKEA